jgi:hypothetical protein
MHTIQYIATQADDVEEAFTSARRYLEAELGDEYGSTNTWFDWFVVGGGRWASKEGNQYNDNFMDDVAPQDDPRFKEYLESAKKVRREELDQYIQSAEKEDYAVILDKIKNTFDSEISYPHELYAIKKVYDMAMGIWDYNSYYFDMIHESTNFDHMQKSIDNGDKNWYLVPVDFHF